MRNECHHIFNPLTCSFYLSFSSSVNGAGGNVGIFYVRPKAKVVSKWANHRAENVQLSFLPSNFTGLSRPPTQENTCYRYELSHSFITTSLKSRLFSPAKTLKRWREWKWIWRRKETGMMPLRLKSGRYRETAWIESKEGAEKSFKEKVEVKACIRVIDMTRCFYLSYLD